MKQKKQIFKKNKEFNLVVDFFGGLTNTAKVLDISYPYASHISTGRRRLSPILCYKIKKSTRGKFDFVNITVLKK
jgi:DNA-binding transcriptional regulator YdaS (Cro superfamily)